MSNYQDFTQDFPARCRRLLRRFRPQAEADGIEVTLLLMAASAGFVIPFERLRDHGKRAQPPLDRADHEGQRNELRRVLGLLVSGTHPFDLLSQWRMGRLKSAEGRPDDWPELDAAQCVPGVTKVKDVILPLRHALAHGNVFTKAGQRGEIVDLVFVSGGVGDLPLKFLLVHPAELFRFMEDWFGFLTKHGIRPEEAAEALGEAA